jgi:hypothetical protein
MPRKLYILWFFDLNMPFLTYYPALIKEHKKKYEGVFAGGAENSSSFT